jgi:hypothetical protein
MLAVRPAGILPAENHRSGGMFVLPAGPCCYASGSVNITAFVCFTPCPPFP